jgi:hypothetical protein
MFQPNQLLADLRSVASNRMNHHTTHQGAKVKPTEQIANSASTPKAGLFATLCRFLHTTGSGAPSRSLIAAPLVALVALLALSVGVVQAEPPKLVSYGNFGTGENPFGIAVDNSGLASAGDVYVAGLAVSNINKYDAAGKLISPPSPFGGGSYSGAAVNPTNGDVYAVINVFNEVSETYEGRIDTYDPSTGALLSSFLVPGCANGLFGNFTWAQIASDSAGNVYLACAPKNEVEVFNSSGGAPSGVAATIAGSGANALSKPTGVAVDSAGNVWVADDGNNRIEEFSSSGAFMAEIKSEQGLQTIAVDSHGDVLALLHNSPASCGSLTPPCTHLVEYSSTGTKLADIGAGSIGEGIYESYGATPMLAVNESSGRVYVIDQANKLVWIYAPPTAPTIGKELSAEVGTSEAKLGALANPGGIPTAYRFEYLTTAEFQANGESFSGVDSATSVPFPEGSVGEGITSRTVWASASGLAPGVTYHYRVVVTNELGTVVGADRTFTTETASQASCPNEQLRGGFSASLPDCRAYELVTPATTISSQPDPSGYHSHEDEPAGLAARDGSRMSYNTIDILPGTDSGARDYVATRGESGWSSESATPRQSYTGDRCTTANTEVTGYSPDLSTAVLFAGGLQTDLTNQERGGGCGAEPVEVVSGEPLGVQNLFLRDNASASYQLINVAPAGVIPENAHFDGASTDLSHLIFDEHAQLTSGAPGGVDDMYDWSNGELRLVTVLPDGTPVVGALAVEWGSHPRVVSENGSHIFFTAGGNLYVRLNGSSTIQVDASKVGGSGGGGQFREASADGSKVFFSDDASAGLTSDTVPGSGTNLYRYDVASGQLIDLTPGGAGELDLGGASEDGSYLYFAARTVLASGATAGQSNIYLWHDGTITFIAKTDLSLAGHAFASPNGALFAFESRMSLTGYDNTDAKGGYPDPEIYLYDAASAELTCVSCNPSGEAPAAGGAELEARYVGAPHPLFDSGRLFFDTAEALVPRDTNGKMDVYEYEDGQPHLISTGTSSTESSLVDASESGNDVFFLTRQQLVPQDTHEELRVIYDARVGGGFPAPAISPPCTTADACRASVSPQPSIYGAPSSQTFSGAGNLASPAKPAVKPKAKALTCKRGFVKKKLKGKSRCVRKLTRKASKAAHAKKRGH